MNKKIYLFLGLLVFLIMYVCLLIKGENLEGLPKGELVASTDSPNKRYTMNLYFIDGGPISANADRIEIVDNKNNKNGIYTMSTREI